MMDGVKNRAEELRALRAVRADVTVRVSACLDARLYYVEGCGQLCAACYAALREARS